MVRWWVVAVLLQHFFSFFAVYLTLDVTLKKQTKTKNFGVETVLPPGRLQRPEQRVGPNTRTVQHPAETVRAESDAKTLFQKQERRRRRTPLPFRVMVQF